MPKLKLCFEYQDDYHYITTWYAHRTREVVSHKDRFDPYSLLKKNLLLQNGETLVEVPCWWDGTEESLIASICFLRPDILPSKHTSCYIPLNPPANFFEDEEVPDVGELMLASFPSSPTQFQSELSPTNYWWLGEKYDGIRLCWHPEHQAIYTRSGNALEYPANFGSILPNTFLDGEIWFGRGLFSESQKLTYGQLSFAAADISFLRIIVFDDPSPSQHGIPFEDRYKRFLNFIALENPLLNVLTADGEGIVMRAPFSPYVHGRSELLYKLKTARMDTEALVLAIEEHHYVLKLPSGTIFTIPTYEEDKLQDNAIRPKQSDIVTISFDNVTRDSIPISPEITRIRMDKEWGQVVVDYMKTKSHPGVLKGDNTAVKPKGFWVSEKHKNLRQFLEDWARKNNFDPLVAENWYNRSKDERHELRRVTAHYQGSYVKALVDLLPEVKFDELKFAVLPRHTWQSVQKRREFMDKFATEHGFDPLIAESWYKLNPAVVLAHKSGWGVLDCYNSSLVRALLHLYPDIGLSREKFGYRKWWASFSERRRFLRTFAENKGFDPLIPENWYSVASNAVRNVKGGGTLLMQYQGSLSKALMGVFPEIGIDRSRFSNNKWVDASNRRIFFMKFAKSNGFDPLVAENWYSIPAHLVRDFMKLLGPAKLKIQNFAKTLMELFPELNLEAKKFLYLKKSLYWSVPENRRKVFLQFAKSKGFDPLIPMNWYSTNLDELFNQKDFKAVNVFYERNTIKALLDLFPDVGLDRRGFSSNKADFWAHPANHQHFFLRFAKRKGFDHRITGNWYNVTTESIEGYQGAKSILKAYDGSIAKALQQVFPDLSWDSTKFTAD